MKPLNDPLFVFVYIMEPKNPDKCSPELVKAHIAYLKKLHSREQLVLCGPFKNAGGGMVVVHASSMEDAIGIAEEDPFVKSGFESYLLRSWEIACEENNYLE
jgi:uncharacterized protein YciI